LIIDHSTIRFNSTIRQEIKMASSDSITGFTVSFTKKEFGEQDDPTHPQAKTEVKVDFNGTISPLTLSTLLDRTSELMASVSGLLERHNTGSLRNEEVQEIVLPVDQDSSDSSDSSEDEKEVDGYRLEGQVQLGGEYSLQDWDKQIAKRAWDNFGSVRVSGRSKNYLVVFPRVQDGTSFGQMSFTGHGIAPSVPEHSWPVCSCEAYHFQSYGRGTAKGSCRHIEACIEGCPTPDNINWTERPVCLPYHLKQKGLAEYAWVPNTHAH
jgi:hypothetical protein